MRPILAIARLGLAASLGYGVVWAFSDPEPDWASGERVAAPQLRSDDGGVPNLLAGVRLGGAAQAASPEYVGLPSEARPAEPRVAPPFTSFTRPDAALALAREAEPLRLEAEQDGEGHWVLGYGRRTPEQPAGSVTAAQAEAMLTEDLARAEEAVRDAVRIPLNANEYAALVEFARSIGAENFAHTLVAALLNAGDREAAADAFMIWTKVRVDGALVDSAELVAQRERARDLFLSTGSVSGA
jgi:lysozyme